MNKNRIYASFLVSALFLTCPVWSKESKFIFGVETYYQVFEFDRSQGPTGELFTYFSTILDLAEIADVRYEEIPYARMQIASRDFDAIFPLFHDPTNRHHIPILSSNFSIYLRKDIESPNKIVAVRTGASEMISKEVLQNHQIELMNISGKDVFQRFFKLIDLNRTHGFAMVDFFEKVLSEKLSDYTKISAYDKPLTFAISVRDVDQAKKIQEAKNKLGDFDTWFDARNSKHLKNVTHPVDRLRSPSTK